MQAAIDALTLKNGKIAQFCCNNGRELMSIVRHTKAREGVGFDLATNILEQAREIAKQTDTPCTFVQGDILAIPPTYADQFDLILTTIGALCWMEDLPAFFSKVFTCLKSGGTLLVNEGHPMADMLALPQESIYDVQNPAKLCYSYFKQEPFVDCFGMLYLAGKTYESKPFYNFLHTLGAVVTSTAQSGLVLNRLTEYDHDIGGNNAPLEGKGFPLSYLMVARKP